MSESGPPGWPGGLQAIVPPVICGGVPWLVGGSPERRVMRLRAEISLEFEVDSVTDAGAHQRALGRAGGAVRRGYPEGMLTITRRRGRLDFGLTRAAEAEPLAGG